MMEIVAIVVQLVECISPSIGQCWKHNRDIHRNMSTLKEKLKNLISRKSDIESKLDIDLVPGETELGNEAKRWLEHVEKIGKDVCFVEEKVGKSKFFSRAKLGRTVIRKIAEVDELQIKGQFPNGLVIQLPRRGDLIPTTSTLGGETTFKRNLEDIWEWLLDDEVTKIGVHGMGGIGKTTALEHIHNRLLKGKKDRFDNVIWVTVSKDANILNLQDKIASKLVGSSVFENDQDIKTRAAKLHAKLITKSRFVLILDDMWQPYALEEVGIPEPTTQNGCKLVVTTRSHDICRVMSCKPIVMELLSEDDALNLFLDVAGRGILFAPNLEPIVKEVVRECAGLALAIVTIAGSLKDVVDIDEWKIALEELREVCKNSVSFGTIERLKFSYDRLSDKKLQDCLLYCSLFPEDFHIERRRLIELLIAEGIIEEKRRESEIRKGKQMLNRLINVSLLIDTIENNEECVKMHDLIRDMALQITGESPRFLVKAGIGLKSLPSKENWKDDLVKVSLMYNRILDVPSNYEPPYCPRLSTLLLSQNYILRSISNNFFLHMKGLKLLDISKSSIYYLPDSFSDLVNLIAVILKGCRFLKHVPSLAKLCNLRMLNLNETNIQEIPHGMENLINLQYLDLSHTWDALKNPEGSLWKLDSLRHLSLRNVKSIKVRAEDLKKLRRLESFEGEFCDINDFNAYVGSFDQQRPINYILKLTKFLSVPRLYYVEGKNKVVLVEYHSVAAGHVLLPKDIETLGVHHCNDGSNLCELASFENATSLKNCTIASCDTIKYLFSYPSCNLPFIHSLEILSLKALQELRGLISEEQGLWSTSRLPCPVTFSSLKELYIQKCHRIKKLFTIASVPNLEVLSLYQCEQLIEISTTSDKHEDEEKEDNEISTKSWDTAIVKTLLLPKLAKLILEDLPMLQRVDITANSLQKVCIRCCPKLNGLSFLDRDRFRKHCLKNIISDDESTREQLGCDHLNARDIISLSSIKRRGNMTEEIMKICPMLSN